MKNYNIKKILNALFYLLLTICLNSNSSLAATPAQTKSQVSTAYAFGECKCPKIPSVTESFNQSQIVFLGQVLKVEKASVVRPNHNVVKMELTKAYKGADLLPKTEFVVIFTPEKEKDCGVSFSKQGDYIVFANGNPAFLKTTLCNLTEVQESRKAEQSKLEELVTEKTTTDKVK